MRLPCFTLLLVLAVPLPAAESTEQNERLQKIAAEVERRRALRQQAEAEARRVVRDHESGAKPATAEELAKARAVLSEADARRAKVTPAQTPKADDMIRLKLPGADMATVVSTWRHLFGGEVMLAESVKSRVVTMEIPSTPRSEIRDKFIAGLRACGVVVIERSDGVVFDSEPAAKSQR